MDGTLLTILLLLVFATVLALIQARGRDRCLKSFGTFQATLVEKNGDLAWGRVLVYASGLEIDYRTPVEAREGHMERSFVFYKEQYEAMDALYRYPGGLSAAEQQRRADIIRATAQPGMGRRLRRKLRNWVGMVRDALVQSAGVIIGLAQTRRPGMVTAQSGEGMKSLSKEVVGRMGSAYDPLLENHLFRQVVLEVTRGDTTHSYCGWLKDYTSQFVEIVDAFANIPGTERPLRSYRVGDEEAPAALRVEDGRLKITNEGTALLHVEEVTSEATGEGWQRPLGCLLPPRTTADLTLPPGTPPEAVVTRIGTAERVDMVVPRAHALVRHAADGSEAHRQAAARSVGADVDTQAPETMPTLETSPAPEANPPGKDPLSDEQAPREARA